MAVESSEAVDAYYAARASYSLQSRRELFRSRDLFRRSVGLNPALAKARSLLAYTLVQAWVQGWSGEEELTEAGDLAREALRQAPDDPYANAQMGFFLLYTRHFEGALACYRRATALPEATGEITVDRAEAEIYAGNVDAGIELIRQAMAAKEEIPDWYRWNLAWGFYVKGRTDRSAYRTALEALDAMRQKPEDQDYPVDCLLFRAVVEKALEMDREADAHLERFLGRRTDWTVWRERQSVRFRNPADELHWLDGCRAAGLPE